MTEKFSEQELELLSEPGNSLESIKMWLRVGSVVQFWYKGLLYSMEAAQDDTETWWLWANAKGNMAEPVFEKTFNSLDDLYSYEFDKGKTLDDVYKPELLEGIS
ncbi:hypothetical protein [Weissella sp. MSCH1]|uniref:hypothetical protein n=1 Tax=Weissella sp. MSCH1 TaxID=3383343 RepID=UPI0038969347